MIQFVLTNGYQETLNYIGTSPHHFYSKDRITFQLLFNIISLNEIHTEWTTRYNCNYDLEADIWSHVEMALSS